MDEEQNAFQTALNEATGVRTAADNAAMAASMDQQMVEFERMAADATHNKENPYFGHPDLIERTRTQLSAIRIRAGLAPAIAPKTPQQMAAEMHAASFSLPDTLHPNWVAAIDARLEPLANDKVLRDETTAALKQELGTAGYAALVKDAATYKTLTDAEKADRLTLQMYASQGQRNQYKRTGKVG